MTNYPENGVKYLPKNIKGKIVAESPSSFAAIIKGECSIGFLSYVGRNSEIVNTDIGRFCSIAPDFFCGPTNHPTDRLSSHLIAFANFGPFRGSDEFKEWCRPPALENNNKRVTIGNDVWIGRGVTVKRGVAIGDGAIVGAGSVVTKDVAPYTIVGGSPAKLIRNRFSPSITHHLLSLKWFEYDLRKKNAPKLDMENIERAVRYLYQLRANKLLKPLSCEKYLIGPRNFCEKVSASSNVESADATTDSL